MTTAGIRNWVSATCVGSIGGLAVVAFGALAHPVLAIGFPIALLAGLLLLAQPFLGVLALSVFSHLDAVEKLVFGFLPVSFFKLTAAATAAVLLLHGMRLRDGIKSLLHDPVAISGLTFLVMCFASAIFADNRGFALSALFDYLSFYLLMVLVIILSRTQGRIEILLYALAGTTFVSAVLFFLDFAAGISIAQAEAATTARTSEGFDRPSGGSNYNPTVTASMLLVGLIFALVHMIETPRYRILMMAVVAIGTFAIILSFARSAVVAYGLIVLLLMWRYRRERYLPLAVFVAICAMVMAVPFVPEAYWERLSTIVGSTSGNDWTLGRRLTYNVIGLDLLVTNPFLGVGPGNYPHHFVDPEYRHLPGRTLLGRELHNMYLSVAVQLGLGSIPFFAMIGYAFASLRSVARAPATPQFRILALSLGYGYGAYLVTCLFLPNEFTKYTWLLAAQCAALYHANRSVQSTS